MAKTNLPAKITEMTMAQAVKTFNEYEQKIYKELQTHIKAHNKDTLVWYWDLGVRLQAIRDTAKKDKDHHGTKLLDRLAVGLGYTSSGPLYQALTVVTAFGTKKAFTEYTKLAGENGNVLTWGHVVMLAGISDTAMRLDLAATALEQCWTVVRLGDQVRSMVDRKSRGIRKGTNKVKIPTSVKKCLHEVTAKAELFRGFVENAWTGDAYDIKAQIEDTPTSSLNEKLLDDFVTAQQRVQSMIASAETLADELYSGETAIRRKLAAQEAANAAALEEDEPTDDEELDDDDVEVEDDDDEADICDDTASLEDLANEGDDDSIGFTSDAEVATDDKFVSIGAERNARLREARALARVADRQRAARKK